MSATGFAVLVDIRVCAKEAAFASFLSAVFKNRKRKKKGGAPYLKGCTSDPGFAHLFAARFDVRSRDGKREGRERKKEKQRGAKGTK